MGSLVVLTDDGNGVHIQDLLVPNREVAEYLKVRADRDWEETLIGVLKTGVSALSAFQPSGDLQVVRLEANRIVEGMQALPAAFAQAVLAQLGTADGQALAPVRVLLAATEQAVKTRVNEVKTLFTDSLDPGRSTSTLGQALVLMHNMLDPKRSDSVPGTMMTLLAEMAAADSPLVEVWKTAAADAVKPVMDQIIELGKEIRGEAEIQARTTAKGDTFEDETVEALQAWCRAHRAEVHHVGGANRPGDLVVILPREPGQSQPWRIAIEARARQNPVGRKSVSDSLTRVMEEYRADAAIYLVQGREGLAQELGGWGSGKLARGPWVATTAEMLLVAVVTLWQIELRFAAREASMATTDAANVRGHVEQIRVALRGVANITRSIGEGRTALRNIEAESESFRRMIQDALLAIEAALR